MADAKIRLNSKTEYVIEVNDDGDTISIDLANPNLVADINEMMDNVEQLKVDYKDVIDFFNNNKTIEDDYFFTEDGKNMAIDLKNYYEDSRKAVDNFLGGNACYKIFGEKNNFLMFDDLFKSLTPLFEKAGVKTEKHYKSLRKEYSNRATRRNRKEL